MPRRSTYKCTQCDFKFFSTVEENGLWGDD